MNENFRENGYISWGVEKAFLSNTLKNRNKEILMNFISTYFKFLYTKSIKSLTNKYIIIYWENNYPKYVMNFHKWMKTIENLLKRIVQKM